MNNPLFSIKNQKSHSFSFDFMLVGMFILLGTFSRFLLVSLGIQPFPNFEVIMVLTFISLFLIRPIFVFLVPLFSMIFSDILLGNPILAGSSMNSIVLFTYTGFLISSFVFLRTKDATHHSLKKITITSIGLCIGVGMLSTLIYDIWTNAGWWYLMYPHTIETFSTVFLAGIPFMFYHQLSTLFTFLTVAIPLGYLLINKHQLLIPDSHQRYEKIPLILATTILILLSFSGSTMASSDHADFWLNDSPDTSVSITVQGSDWKISDHFILSESQSVLDILYQISEKHNVMVESHYDSMFESTIITSIQEDINGDNGFYWQYMVNKEAPITGADTILVSNGDSILWHYSQFL
jgi:hypothetical protein